MSQPQHPYEQEKTQLEHADEKALDDGVDRHLEVHVPESLRGLSQDELAAMDRKITRKMDYTLMPILIWLYVLNFLDRNSESILSQLPLHLLPLPVPPLPVRADRKTWRPQRLAK